MRYLLIALSTLFIVSSCDKEKLRGAQDIPEELAYLVGEWTVISYEENLKEDEQPSEEDPTYFDKVVFTETQIELYKAEEYLHGGNSRFVIDKDTGKDRVAFILAKYKVEFDHLIDYNGSLLTLTSVYAEIPAGINYTLVKTN